MKTFSIGYVLLTIQRALLGKVMPKLRAVFVDKFSGKEIKTGGFQPGTPGYHETVNFGEFIGYDVDPKNGEKIATTWGKIHYAKDGVHIVPTAPRKACVSEDFEYALLGMQRALLGEVTPELRAVFVGLDIDENMMIARFYYDGEISQELHDLWMSASAEVKADFGSCTLDAAVERVDYPNTYPFRGRYAYEKKGDRMACFNTCRLE